MVKIKRYRVVKIVYAKNISAAISQEKKTPPVEITLDEPVELEVEKKVKMGF